MELTINYDAVAETIVERLKTRLCNVDINSVTKLASLTSGELPDSLSQEEIHNFLEGMVVIDDLMTEAKTLEKICSAAREAGQIGPNLVTALFIIDLANTVRNAITSDSGWEDFIKTCREYLEAEK